MSESEERNKRLMAYAVDIEGYGPAMHETGIQRAADIRSLVDENRRLREALGEGGPWPVVDVLVELSNAARHLLQVHGCDGHGYEGIDFAAHAALMIEPRIRAALAGKASE